MTLNLHALAQQFGTIIHEGTEYILAEQPDFTNRVFPGWFGDAQDGETYIDEWAAKAYDAQGNLYQVVWQFEVIKGAEPESDNHDWSDVHIVKFVEAAKEQTEDMEPSNWSQVYNHPSLQRYVAAEKAPHIDALHAAGLLDALTADQCAAVVVIAQNAYRNGQLSQGAERIDSDAIWVDGIGGLERQVDGTWTLTMPDSNNASLAAAALGSRTSEKKAIASRANGQRGGRPRKTRAT